MRTAVADAIGIPESGLRVIAPDVGGGFGQKMSLSPEFVLVAWLARRLRSSVAWTEDRRENLVACYHSRDQHIVLEGSFDADARLVALDADVVANIGAYSCYPTTCGVEPLMAMAELPGPYDVREYACRARGVATNTCPMAPYRGVSRPVITFAMERLVDKAAAAFAIDPVAIRRRNLIRTFPYTSATGLVFDEASYVETLDAAIDAIDIPAFRARQAKARAAGRHLGLGISTFSERTGYGTPAFAARGMEVMPGWETVDLSMDPSGFVEARIGASPHGQGLRTTLAQIIADELGVTPDPVRIVHGDTDRTPYGWGTFASRSLVIAGGASLMAARKVSAKLRVMAGHLLEAAVGDIVLEHGRARVTGTDRGIAIATVARAAYHQTQRLPGELAPGLTESATYDPPGTFSSMPHRHRRSGCRDRKSGDREIPGGGGCRPPHQSDDRRRPDSRRRRARPRQCAARRDRLRRNRKHPHRDAGRLPAADRPRDAPDRHSASRDPHFGFGDQGQGAGRGRCHRGAGGHRQRHQRCTGAVRRFHRRIPGDAAAHPRRTALREAGLSPWDSWAVRFRAWKTARW
jgi:aerobic carbon-monoxide dehydrogenase large subunit